MPRAGTGECEIDQGAAWAEDQKPCSTFWSLKSRENSKEKIFILPLPPECGCSWLVELDWNSAKSVVSVEHFQAPPPGILLLTVEKGQRGGYPLPQVQSSDAPQPIRHPLGKH